MSNKGIPVIVLLIVLATLHSVAQDKIYLASSTRQGKITAITAATVTYRPTLEKSQLVNIPLSKVILLINDYGGWLAPSQLNFEEEKSKESVNSFLTQDKPTYTEDRIYSADGLRIDGKILDEDDKSITAVVNNVTKQISKNALVAIWYRNGRHTILGTITEVKEALVKSKSMSGKQAMLTMAQKEDIHSSKTVKAETNITSQPATLPNNTQPESFEELAGAISKKEFTDKTSQKTNQFNIYLKLLCDKSNPQDEKNKVIEQALTLFVSDTVKVEISSLNNTDIDKPTIKNYLRKVKMLNYDKIELEWTNVQYVTDARQDPDGIWHGTVVFEQTFKGYRDGELIYKDITKKYAEVILKQYNKNIEGQKLSYWDVLLSDIGVRWTKNENE